jgi:flagellar protein FliO/FliZ
MSWLTWLFILILLAAAGGAAFLAYRTYMFGDAGLNVGSWLFKPKPEPRLGVVEQVSVDGRRRLVLVRRDDVEHLIMTGGPVDVLIENNIKAVAPEPAAATSAEQSPPVFTRQPRNFGQAVNE